MTYHLPAPTEWVRVIGMRFFAHRKTFTSAPCLGVTYVTENGDVTEYLPVEHDGSLMRTLVGRAWFQLGGDAPVPVTVAEALERTGELTVREIEVETEGRFPKVLCRRCYALLGPPATYWAGGPPPPMW